MAATVNGKTSPKIPAEKIWCSIGDLNYGTSKTDKELEKRAEYILMHPEIFRAMHKRKEYQEWERQVVITAKNIMHVLDKSERTAQRLLNDARKKPRRGYITIKEFCYLNKLDEVTVRKKIITI